MIAVGLVFWRDLSALMKRVVFVEVCGVAVFYALSDYQVLAVRAREFFLSSGSFLLLRRFV